MSVEIGFFIAAIILLAAVVYGVMRNRNRSHTSKAVTDSATKDLYKDPDKFKRDEDSYRREAR